MSNSETRFDGDTIEPEKDNIRLESQLYRVKELMSDSEWRSLFEIKNELVSRGKNCSEAGISARLRDLRKDKFGGHTVNRRRRESGTFEYQLILK